MNINTCFENGQIGTISEIVKLENKSFDPHPNLRGIFLKNLVTGDMTDNKISCHLVKVEPFCILDTHVHENNLEIHEIISGDATCYIGENKINYSAGSIGVIPANVSHKVEAGPNGLYILAKFTPALL